MVDIPEGSPNQIELAQMKRDLFRNWFIVLRASLEPIYPREILTLTELIEISWEHALSETEWRTKTQILNQLLIAITKLNEDRSQNDQKLFITPELDIGLVTQLVDISRYRNMVLRQQVDQIDSNVKIYRYKKIGLNEVDINRQPLYSNTLAMGNG